MCFDVREIDSHVYQIKDSKIGYKYFDIIDTNMQ